MMNSVIAIVVIGCVVSTIHAETLYEALGRNQELSEFYKLVSKDEVLQVLLDRRTVTTFAPTNEAIQRAAGRRTIDDESKLPSYHVLNFIATKDKFPTSIHPYLAGVAPLYLNKKKVRDGWEYYVNNAKVIKEDNYRGTEGGNQLLYVIDELLEPYMPITNLAPTALDFLNQPTIYSFKEQFGAFASRVISDYDKDLYRRVGNHTYFLPVGAVGDQNFNRLQEIDNLVVRGHVIPNHVFFTRTVEDFSYHSEAYNINLKVTLAVVNESSPFGTGYDMYAQSNTIQADHRHRKGVVRAKIIRPNIPVSNGVVHLIENPLMIIDQTIMDILERERTGRLSEFAKIVNHDKDFAAHLSSSSEKTLFAPTNEALNALSDEKMSTLRENISAASNLLQLHMVMKSVATEDVAVGKVDELLAADNRRSLYFRVVGDERNKTLTVEGGGVNATAIRADFGATNGILHIIDKVLGMPFLTIYKKMEKDGELQPTFELGSQDQWNLQLNDNRKRFTFFVPSRQAWERLSQDMPSEHKQLNMGVFTYHVKKILDRHLVIGHEYTSQDLERLDEIQMVHGTFKINKGYNYEMTVDWEGVQAKIVRPDVQATNGIIHVIDRVLMKPRDLTKSEASHMSLPLTNFLILIVSIMILRL